MAKNYDMAKTSVVVSLIYLVVIMFEVYMEILSFGKTGWVYLHDIW